MTTYECCGKYLPSGECCAAIYGDANLIPVDPEPEEDEEQWESFWNTVDQ